MVYVTARPGKDIALLEQQVMEEVKKLSDNGPSADELERSRTGLYVGMLRGMERVGGSGGKSDLLASAQVLTGNPDAWQQEMQWLRDATPAKVQTSLNTWLNHGHLTLRVEPTAAGKTHSSSIDRSKLPASGAGKPLQLPELQRAKLSNGLEVVLLERHELPLVDVRLLSRAGYAADPKGKEGLANLTMSMLDEGTSSRDTLQIAEELEKLGANIGSGASLDVLSVSLSAVTTRLPAALNLYQDIILNPAFPQQQLDRLRPRILAGIAQEKASPFSAGLRILPPLLYGAEHPYGVPMTGSGYEASVAAIERDDIVSFYQQHLVPQNSQFLVVGDIKMDELKVLLEKSFGHWKAPQAVAAPVLAERPLAAKPRIYLLDKPGAPQTVILAGHLAPPPSDPDELAMQAANTAFGGLFTSRINMNLREDKHWAYGAGSALVGARGQRPFIVYSRVQGDKTVPAVKEIRRELQDLNGTQRLSAKELDAVVRNETLSLPGNNESLGQLAGSVSKILIQNLPDNYYNDYVKNMNAMSVDDMRNGAQKLVHPEALTWVLIGDLAAHRAALKKLGWGEIIELKQD